MKNFTLKTIALAVVSLFYANAGAQLCSGSGRYFDDNYFQDFDKTTVTYSTTYNLQMDIYQPQGDTVAQRPVIVLAHGGSFIGGSKAEATVSTLAERFAKRGYVTASIQYRLGNIMDMLQAQSAYDVVIKAVSDGKAAVRYFRKDAADSNNYRINPNLIFGGGNSAGAVLFVHLGYIDSVNEVTNADINTALTNNGGIDGNSGNAGYSSAISGILNLAGGINDTSWISAGNIPMASFHGTTDNVVPYYCANAQGGVTPAVLCGTGAMQPRIENLGIDNNVLLFPGDGHVPWESNAAKFNSVDSLSKVFMYRQICKVLDGGGNPSSINNVKENIGISLYPNPNNGNFFVRVDKLVENTTLEIYNQMGQLVKQQTLSDLISPVSVEGYRAGIYAVRITGNNGSAAVSRIIIQ